MRFDNRTIVREHSEEFDEVPADLNEFELEEIMKQTFITFHHQTYERTKSFKKMF